MTIPQTAPLIALLSLAILPLTAAPVVTITSDRPDALYMENEKVTFTIAARDGTSDLDASTIAWTLSVDGHNPLASGTGTTAKGSLDRPGFLLVTAIYTAADGKKITGY